MNPFLNPKVYTNIRKLLKNRIIVIITGTVLFSVGILSLVNLGLGFETDPLNGMTISIVGIILTMIGAFLWKMKKVNPIKQDYEELGDTEKDSDD